VIISIRASNGGGKSHVVRALLQQGVALPIYGVLGPKQPEAYSLCLSDRITYVLGPYITATGGCDRINPYDLILDLIEKYAKLGNVVFEGVLVSSSYGRVGTLMERWGQEAVMAFLTTSLEDCIRNVQTRRDARADAKPFNPKNLTSKYHQIVKSRLKMLKEGKVRVVDLEPATALEQVLALLKGAA
jgi:hypothetical protein